MSIANTSKPTTSIVNTAKASFALLWSTITTTWGTETQTWGETISVIDNTTKQTTTITNTAKP